MFRPKAKPGGKRNSSGLMHNLVIEMVLNVEGCKEKKQRQNRCRVTSHWRGRKEGRRTYDCLIN
jgi:hypothetical protein